MAFKSVENRFRLLETFVYRCLDTFQKTFHRISTRKFAAGRLLCTPLWIRKHQTVFTLSAEDNPPPAPQNTDERRQPSPTCCTYKTITHTHNPELR